MLWTPVTRRSTPKLLVTAFSNNGRLVSGSLTGYGNAYNSRVVVDNNVGAAVTKVLPCRHVHVERRLTDMGIVLPPAPTPRANYNIACHASGNMLYISGHLPFTADGTLLTGRVGPPLTTHDNHDPQPRTLEFGYQAARHAGLNIICTIQSQLDGDLDRVEQIVKLFGIVNSTNDFKQQHLVMDGCSDVIMEVFGPKIGYHARSAIGTNTLPLDATIEVEAIIQITPKTSD